MNLGLPVRSMIKNSPPSNQCSKIDRQWRAWESQEAHNIRNVNLISGLAIITYHFFLPSFNWIQYPIYFDSKAIKRLAIVRLAADDLKKATYMYISWSIHGCALHGRQRPFWGNSFWTTFWINHPLTIWLVLLSIIWQYLVDWYLISTFRSITC